MSESREATITAIANYLASRIADELRANMKTCLNCQHYDEPRNTCNKNARTPPPRIIAFGCNAFEERTPF